MDHPALCLTSFSLIITLFAWISTVLLVFLASNAKVKVLRSEHIVLQSANDDLRAQMDLLRRQRDEDQAGKRQLERSNIHLMSELEQSIKNLEFYKSNTAQQSVQFENIANRLLESHAQSFTQKQEKGIREILLPLQEKIKVFEQKVEASNHESFKRHISLKEQISFLSKQSQQVSEEANNLAKALKGDYKKQGNWGELILEMILEKSGLEKDREYYVQESLRDSNGMIKKPDVIIHLPNKKRLIIDSKVSLIAYDQFCASGDREEGRLHQKNHASAIRKHIDGLSDKNYHELYKSESPDFVLMFVPIDSAFSVALQYDGSIYEYGFKKNIIIVTPSTLLATLKTIETLWRNEKQNRFAVQIAEEAGKMYDKFVLFLKDMEKMGIQLETVKQTYKDSIKKLSEGNGNLIRKAELVKSLGAKANKSIGMTVLHRGS